MSIETTTTLGYYNGNKWPIQLVISSLNITLHLPPGEFVKDRQGRKINDPFFETYAHNRQLCRETSEKPVALIRVPLPNPVVTPHDGQSVREVKEFTHSKDGVRVPVIPQPRLIQAQTINKNSVQPMTMDEARKRGLAHRTREVPEDYGMPDTDSALPPRLPPPIRVATDLKPTKIQPLPAELMEAATEDVPAANRAIVTQLSQKVTSLPPEEESETGFMNAVTQNAPANSPIATGPMPAPRPAPVSKRIPPPQQPIAEEIEEELPSPSLEEPPLEEEEEPRPITARNKYACMSCGAGFPFRSQLERHAQTKHKSEVEAIMATYPESR